MSWWINTKISDNDIEVTGIDSRIVVPYEECGNIFQELFRYAIDINNTNLFSCVIWKEKDILVSKIRLSAKSEIETFQDLRFTIKSYKYIMSVFLSLGVIPEPKTIEDRINFELINQDIKNRANTLEYYLLNNPYSIINARSYYDGRIELNYHRLITEIYRLAINGNKYCQWMINFNTPLQIWFISTIQQTYLLWSNSLKNKISNRQYYKYWIDYLNEFSINILKNDLKELENQNSFDISEALNFTVKQLIIDNTPKITTLYTSCLETIKKQAYLIDKNKKYRGL